MIPKIIHYCWFGGNPLPEDVKKYIATWRKYCPDYEIKQWDESNFDVSENSYCREAYEARKWAFVSDYARLKILYEEGGVYMDTDVEACRPLDELLNYEAFSGFESGNRIQTGTFGAAKGSGWIGFLLSYYEGRHFRKADGTLDETTNVMTISRMTKEKYDVSLNNTMQIFGENNALFPFDWLCAKDQMDGKIKRTKNTYTIHHFAGSWLSPSKRLRHRVKLVLVKVLGPGFVLKIKRIFHIGDDQVTFR